MVDITFTLKPDPDQPNIDPDLLLELGRLITWWSRIEFILYTTVMHLRTIPEALLYDKDKEIQIATRRLITQWRRLFKGLYDHAGLPPTIIDRLAQRLRTSANKRKEYVHSFWPAVEIGDAMELSLLNLKPDKKGLLQTKNISVSAKKLRAENEKLRSLYFKVSEISFAFQMTKSLPIPKDERDGK